MFWQYLWFGIMVLLVFGGPTFALGHGRKRLKKWRQAAESSRLTVVKDSNLPLVRHLTARSGPVEMRLSEQKDDVRVVASIMEGPPDLFEVTIRREVLPLPGRREIKTGDEKFDDAFVIKGPQPFVRALLDASTRRMLMEAKIEGWVELVDGELRLDFREAKLAHVLGLFRDLGSRFADQQELPRRLLENVRHDPEAGVRLQNLLVLIREYPGDPSTVRALHVGTKDSNPEVRLRAAQALGAEGRDVLQELAKGLKEDAVSAQAVTALGLALPLERLQSILGGARQKRMTETARACLEALAILGGAAVGTLVKVLDDDSSELAATAARGLGKIGDPAAEPPLLAALERDNPDLQEAAAEALGRVGSAAAVLPLQEAADRSSALHDAALQAIAGIQERLQGASPGQLSLAATDAGQLSLADDAGQLSLAPHPTEQLPLPTPPPPQRTR
ncbi:MAG TPA: HEAT repeat domain-containing protein [Thermoanaerobaculia bacterium]|nr:HEAT repeat domain-containing protein [Thermoanaerobaculia bacterium]